MEKVDTCSYKGQKHGSRLIQKYRQYDWLVMVNLWSVNVLSHPGHICKLNQRQLDFIISLTAVDSICP